MKVSIKTSFGVVEIGDNLPTHLIAEIGLNHNGSLELAKKMTYHAALSGASIVKFQKRSPENLAIASFLDEPFVKCPAFGKTQRQVRERLELSFNQYVELKKYTESLGLIFCVTAFDLKSLEFLMKLETPIIKIASHSITNQELLQKIAEYNIPVICSFGATTAEERDRAFQILKGNPLVIMHCVSSYPTPDNLAKIDTIKYYSEKYKVPIGYSSHENGIDLSIAASVIGATVIERHFTLNRAMIGLDQSISLLPKEFSKLALKIRRIANSIGISKDLISEEKGTKYSYHVAVCSKDEILKGDIIKRENIICKQPLSDPEKFFTGFEMDEVIGKRAKRNISKDIQISRTDIE